MLSEQACYPPGLACYFSPAASACYPGKDGKICVAPAPWPLLPARASPSSSRAHTVGTARCVSFRTRVYCDDNVSASFASQQRQICPASGGDDAAAELDATTPDVFDNGYYRSLAAGAGLLHSDQELFNNGPLDPLVRIYSANGDAFFADFAASMVRLGNVSPLTGTDGEIRLNCKTVNS
ncbi:unnamed protein product [Urochloa humidicola]